MLVDQFHDHVLGLLGAVRERNRAALAELGALAGASLAAGGVLHLFGSGHSSVLAQELVHRAGGLVPVSALLDPTNGMVETLPGYGARLYERHAARFGMARGEVLVVISNSGRNPVPVEIALAAKAGGLVVAALTSLDAARASAPTAHGHPKLHEVADHVLDNLGAPGDAALAADGLDERVGPTSTLTGAHLLQLLALEAIDWLRARGHPVPLLRSANLPGGRERNAALSQQYRHRLSRGF